MLYGRVWRGEKELSIEVLILIFLENALRLLLLLFNIFIALTVLILIFLENALRQIYDEFMFFYKTVLILIFLENALRPSARRAKLISFALSSLNPYFFGKCSTAQ